MSASAPVLASVVVALIGDFARRTVAEQDRLKTGVEDLVVREMRPLPSDGRILLDAAHGVAVAVLDSPRLALELALRIQRGAADLPLHIGVNHGPIRALDDASREGELAGDGLATALILAEAARPGSLIASRTFRDALASDFPAVAARLARAGEHTDSQIRTHELYMLDQRALRARRLRLAGAGAVGLAAILGVGVAARMVIEAHFAPAVIQLQISPRGEIYVDGVPKGDSPPLTRLDVRPGPHTVEVRNDPHPPLRVEINPRPGEELTIAHAFATKRLPKKRSDPSLGDSVKEGWRSFRRSVGF